MTARPIPPHGSEARYQGTTNRPACRCQTCRNGWNRAHQKRALDRLEGRPPKIPSAPVTAHIRTLLAANMTLGQIATAAGVNSATISDHALGKWPTLRRSVAAKILRVQPGQLTATARIDATGTRRRLRALYAVGHGVYTIAATHPDLNARALDYILDGTRHTCTVTIRDAVAAVYRTLSRKPGSSPRARNRATREGWHGPLAWGDIDNPNAQPDLDDTTPLQLRRDDEARHIADEVQHLARFGIPVPEIARRVGRSQSYVREQVAGRRGPGWRDAQRQAEREAAA